jgi:hypothetical protein
MDKQAITAALREQAGKADWEEGFGPIRTLSFSRSATIDMRRRDRQVAAILGDGFVYSKAGDDLFVALGDKFNQGGSQ